MYWIAQQWLLIQDRWGLCSGGLQYRVICTYSKIPLNVRMYYVCTKRDTVGDVSVVVFLQRTLKSFLCV